MSQEEKLAIAAYKEIQANAGSNMLMQGASAILGTIFTAGVDIAVIGTHYVPLFNNIRAIYGRGPIVDDVIIPIVKNILQECLFDLVNDKFFGYIPIIGIYFNVVCAKTMSWRLGILFSMLASRGDEIDADIVKDCMIVIRNMFPQNMTTYKLTQPDLPTFKKMVMSVYNNPQQEFADKINKAKEAFK